MGLPWINLLAKGEIGPQYVEGAIPATPEFFDIANNPFGEALHSRVNIRLMDGQNLLARSLNLLNIGDNVWAYSNHLFKSSDYKIVPAGYGTGIFRWYLLANAVPEEYAEQEFICPSGRCRLSAVLYPDTSTTFLLQIAVGGVVKVSSMWLIGGTVVQYPTGDIAVESTYTEDISSGFWRVSVLWNPADAGTENQTCTARICPAGVSDTAGHGSYAGSAQLELGVDDEAPFNYVPTVAVPITRTVGRLLMVTDVEPLIDISVVRRMREREFGVAQASTWSIQMENFSGLLLAYNFRGAWIAIESGFPVAGEWGLLAQGRIDSIEPTTDGVVSFSCKDPVWDLLAGSTDREMRIGSTPWAGHIYAVAKAEDSGDYDSATPVEVQTITPTDVHDQLNTIEFMTAVTYKIVYEDGSEDDNGGAGYSIAADELVEDVGGEPVLMIYAAGWGAGPFATGDLFSFGTSAPMSTGLLCPVNAIWHIINNIARIVVLDAIAGTYYSNPCRRFGEDWAPAAGDQITAGDRIEATFPAGTDYMTMIQGALKTFHGSIFPTATGQIGLWALAPDNTVEIELNGDPEQGDINILDGASYVDSMENVVNRVLFKYFSLFDGAPAQYTASNPATLYPDLDLPATIETPWEVTPLTIAASAEKYLRRFADARRIYRIPTQLDGMALGMNAAASVTEPLLNLSRQRMEISEIAIDPDGNEIELTGYVDPVVNADYFIIGDLLTVPEGSKIGSTDKIL